MQHRYYTISNVRFRCRWLTSPKTYDIALRRRIQYRIIRYAFRSIRYACLGRRQARRDVLAMPLQLPRVLFPDPRPCRMVCIAQAQCRSPFPQSGTGRCGQCGWRLPCMTSAIWGFALRALFALCALFVHFSRGPIHGPRNKFPACWSRLFERTSRCMAV